MYVSRRGDQAICSVVLLCKLKKLIMTSQWIRTCKGIYQSIHTENQTKHFPAISVFSIVCDCGHNKANSEMLKNAAMAYQRELRALVNSGRYDTRGDFTVVLQPFFKNTEPPTLVRLRNIWVLFRITFKSFDE